MKFFHNKQRLIDGVGPQSYNVTPNIQKLNHNSKTFTTSMRRFQFNEKIEATDKYSQDAQAPLSKSILDWRKIHLVAGKGKDQSPGPGQYAYPSEFRQYISEKCF